MGNQERVFMELAQFTQRHQTGWVHMKEIHASRYASKRHEGVYRKFYNFGTEFKLCVYVDGTVRLSEYPYEAWLDASVGRKWGSQIHTVTLGDDLTELVDRVKQMIQNEQAEEFINVFYGASNFDGVTPQERKELEDAREAEMQGELDDYEQKQDEAKGFWATLFGGK